MNNASKHNNLLRQNNKIQDQTERLITLNSLPSTLDEIESTKSINLPCKILTFPSTDTLYPNYQIDCQAKKIQQDYFSPFGSVKFYGVRNTSHKDFSRNKIRIIPRVPKPDSLQSNNWPSCSFFGLYTGHAGNSCASFLKENLHKYIFASIHFPQSPKKAIFEGFSKADSEYLKEAEDKCSLSGAFAVIVLIIGKKCYVANTGKAQSLISMNNGTRIIKLSSFHSPENLSERNRVLASGGKLFKDFIIDKKGEKQEIGMFKIIPGKKEFTRSFGDPDCKLQKFGGNCGVIVPDPHIKSFKINEFCDFLCLTSENINQHFDDQQLVNIFWQSIGEYESAASPITSRLNYLSEIFGQNCEGNSSIVLIGLAKINYE